MADNGKNVETSEKEEVKQIVRDGLYWIFHPAEETDDDNDVSRKMIKCFVPQEKLTTVRDFVQEQYVSQDLKRNYQGKISEVAILEEKLARLEGSSSRESIRLERKLEETQRTILANIPSSWHA